MRFLLTLIGILLCSTLCTFVYVLHLPTKTVSEQLTSIVVNKDTAAAMEYLAKQMETSSDVNEFCHGLTHNIGHDAYDKYGFSAAMQQGDDTCGSGYFHGVIEKHFVNDAAVLKTFKTICKPNDGRCFHGIGHGLMFANKNNVPAAIALCNTLETNAQKVQCSEGVFMEHFNTNVSIHPNQFLDLNHPEAICNEQSPLFASACYFYIVDFLLKKHQKNFAEVIPECMEFLSIYRATCIKGLGSRAAKYNMNAISAALQICTMVPAELQATCYKGIISYAIVHYASVNKAEPICALFPVIFQTDCKSVLVDSREYYAD